MHKIERGEVTAITACSMIKKKTNKVYTKRGCVHLILVKRKITL